MAVILAFDVALKVARAFCNGVGGAGVNSAKRRARRFASTEAVARQSSATRFEMESQPIVLFRTGWKSEGRPLGFDNQRANPLQINTC